MAAALEYPLRDVTLAVVHGLEIKGIIEPMTLHLIFSTWLQADSDLLSLVNAVGTFAATETGWSNPEGDGCDSYVLLGTHSPKGGQASVSHIRERAVAQIRERVALGETSAVHLGVGGSWQDPYVINHEVYNDWGVGILVHEATAENPLSRVDFRLREASFWFATHSNADIFFDKDHTVRENEKLGYEMKEAPVQPSWAPADYGKMYVAEETISQKNRLRLIEGIARLIKAFAPPAAALHYGTETWYDPAPRILYLASAAASLMYYTDRGVRVALEVQEQSTISVPGLFP